MLQVCVCSKCSEQMVLSCLPFPPYIFNPFLTHLSALRLKQITCTQAAQLGLDAGLSSVLLEGPWDSILVYEV